LGGVLIRSWSSLLGVKAFVHDSTVAIIAALEVPAVSIRIPNPDNNIHSPNENLRIGNYLEGIQACLSILTQNLN
jgi:acetylornithine deacetylase/succinyl-diaminopimelate desuccinylase-like protein